MISGIILASGHAIRMGKQQKLLLNIGHKPMLQRVIEAIKASNIDEIILVYSDHRIKTMGTKYGLITIHNPNSLDGQSTSIRRGIEATNADTSGYMLLVGDQPFLQVSVINKMIEVFNKGKFGIIQPLYDEQRGSPVLFHKRFKKDLLKLEGDIGCNNIIDENSHETFFLSFDNPIFGKDIDTWEIYEEFRDRG